MDILGKGLYAAPPPMYFLVFAKFLQRSSEEERKLQFPRCNYELISIYHSDSVMASCSHVSLIVLFISELWFLEPQQPATPCQQGRKSFTLGEK